MASQKQEQLPADILCDIQIKIKKQRKEKSILCCSELIWESLGALDVCEKDKRTQTGWIWSSQGTHQNVDTMGREVTNTSGGTRGCSIFLLLLLFYSASPWTELWGWNESQLHRIPKRGRQGREPVRNELNVPLQPVWSLWLMHRFLCSPNTTGRKIPMEFPSTAIPAGSCPASSLGVCLLSLEAPSATCIWGSACAGDDRSAVSLHFYCSNWWFYSP